MATVDLNAENFAQVVSENEIVLVDFWASWCGPCRRFGPIFDEASEKHPGIVFAKVDTEAQREIAGAFNIMSIPTLMAFRDQVVLYAEAGALPGEMLESLIEQVEAVDMDDVRAELAKQAAADADADAAQDDLTTAGEGV